MTPLYKLSYLAVFLLLPIAPILRGQARSTATIEYHFPMAGSDYVPVASPVILRASEAIKPASLTGESFSAVGSISGTHMGTVRLLDDDRTILFRPSHSFTPNEIVTFSEDGIQSAGDGSIAPVSFSFQISPALGSSAMQTTPFVSYPKYFKFDAPASLPSDWPTMRVLTNDNPAPGMLFLATFDAAPNAGPNGAYRMILDSLGNPVYFAKPSRMLDFDFKLLPNGHLAFCEGGYVGASQAVIDAGTKYYEMDSTFSIIDSFTVRTDSSSYATDFHDIEFLPNGHVLMLGTDTLPGWDMSKDLPDGNKNALFVGAVIEELDASHDPVWVWRSWDPGHFLDTDAENEDLTGPTVDAVHANAIEQDTDGNILLSSRHLDEISKIDRTDANGSFLWRLGGKHNQFTFVNDSIHFSHQHAVRRIANGDLTLFDNGNYRHFLNVYDTIIDSSSPPSIDTIIDTLHPNFARACEYRLDIPAMTATLVWHYDHDSTIQSTAMGYMQRLDNGNTLVNWGLAFSPRGFVDQPTITEVTPDKKVVYELQIASPIFTYRAYKFPWNRITSEVGGSNPAAGLLKLGEPYPNPAAGAVRVMLGSELPEHGDLLLYDALGRVMRTYYSGPLPPVLALDLETSGLANGSYQLILRTAHGTATRELVVMR